MNIVYKRTTLQKDGICFTKSLEGAYQPLVVCLLGWNHKW